jgi:hypothetical protein
MTFADLVQNAAGISAIVAALTFLIGIVAVIKTLAEYATQNSMKRFEKFQEMRKRFKDNPRFLHIYQLLDKGDDRELLTIDFKDKLEFLSYFEEIALMRNSGLLKTSVAHYMFGYYVIRCYKSDNFWNNKVMRESYYWSVFRKFAEEMEEIDRTIAHDKPSALAKRFTF